MSKNGKLSRFLNGKGFYVALGICMVAIGISAWTAMTKMSDTPKTAESSDSTVSIVTDTPTDTATNKTESDVEDTRTEVSSVFNTSSEPAEVSSDEVEAAAPVAKYFVFPVSGEVIKNFSNSELQYSLTYNDMRLHKGIDIKADAGTAVKAAGDGTVISAEKDGEFGYTVKIDHGNGVVGVYAGLTEKMAVAKGDTVKSGTNLGALGTVANECVDAPHLHLEFYKNDSPVDPLTLLNE